jgi:putative flippase GtrA
MAKRAAKFQVVGLLGLGVQLAALWLFKGRLHLQTAVATALAVELAILHNFAWHERWTWKSDTGKRSAREVWKMLMKFHMGAGGVSLVTSTVLTPLLSDGLKIHYLAANIIAVGAAAVVNFLINHHWVFAAPTENGSD